MKKILKWGLIGLVGLAVLGALFGEDEAASGPGKADASTPAATATPEPTPEPKPASRVTYKGPETVRSDAVTLRGTVWPKNANVRVRGKRATVRNGRWSMPVTLTRRGDTSFEVLVTRKGYERSVTTPTVTRELSAAEREAIRVEQARIRAERAARRAAARAERAAARANARAVEAAESYLELSGFSKQGLYEQLSSEYGDDFTEAEAQYAVDHVDANWNQEAVESARSYLDMSAMSRSGLIDQLTSSYGDGYTYEQATYAVNEVY